MDIQNDPEFRPKWKYRRRVIFITLFFCMGIIAYITGFGEDNELTRDIVLYTYALFATNILMYVFGATWDDLNVFKFLKR